jgi:SSS family solute:Na+ symporter
MPEQSAGFTWLDGAVLGAYFVGITAFGFWMSRRVKSSQGYFLGDRRLRWWVMVGQMFGTGTNVENPVAQAGAAYHSGFASIWYQWKNMLITPFYWFMAPWYRRSGKTTVGEIIEDRYGRRMALLYSLMAIAFFIFNQGAMLKGAGKVISMATGGDVISPNGVVLAMTAAFIVYSFFGGLVASAYTDFVQSFMIILLSFMLIPKGLAAVGGFGAMRDALPPEFFSLYGEQSGMDLVTIVLLTVNGLVGITAMPHMVSMTASGSTERAGRVGMTYGAMVKRFCTIGWVLTGLIVAAMLVQRGTSLPDKEAAFGFACQALLGPGLTGLMVACLLAANMSTCSNFMVNTGALFTRNVYRDYLNPAANDRQLLLMGRLSGLFLAGLGVLFAFAVDQVLDAFLFTETIAAFTGIMFLGGLLWKRANRHGALASVVVAFAAYYLLNRQSTGNWRLVYVWTATPFGWAMLAGFIALIIVSLLSKAEDAQNIDRFFGRLERSSDGDSLLNNERSGPSAADEGKDLILLDIPGWLRAKRWNGFWRRYREDLIGFVLAWASVGLLVLSAWLIAQIGAT